MSRVHELFRKIEKNRTPVVDNLLIYDPGDTSGWTTRDLSTYVHNSVTGGAALNGGTMTLTDGVDYVITSSSLAVQKCLLFVGGRNIVIRGIDFEIDKFYDYNEANQSCMRIQKSASLTTPTIADFYRNVYIQGCRFGGFCAADSIVCNCPEAIVYVEQCYGASGMWGRENNGSTRLDVAPETRGSISVGAALDTPHPDVAGQHWGNSRGYYQHNCTWRPTYQSMFWIQSGSPKTNLEMVAYNVNVRSYEDTDNLEINLQPGVNPRTGRVLTSDFPLDGFPTGRSAPAFSWWLNSDNNVSGAAVQAENVWLQHRNNTFAEDNVIWPQGGTFGDDATGHYAQPQYLTHGKLYEGNPPDGDFWAVAACGSDWVNPGYRLQTAPVITTTTLAAMTQSVVYRSAIAMTGERPCTWSISAGSLPAGLTLNTRSGVIYGTPTASGAYSFTVQASNNGGSDTQAYSGSVA